MPQRVICERCGKVLYTGDDLKPPDEIILMHNGQCPKCGKKLALVPTKIDVKPAD